MFNFDAFDTKEGIEKACESLGDFNKLLDERFIAGYEKKMRLDEFIVKGYIYLDTCGNAMIIKELTDKEYNPIDPSILPLVIEKEKFKYRFVATLGNNIPCEYIRCTHCGEKWDISNIKNVVTKSSNIDLPLNDLVGKPISEIKKFYANREDGIYYMARSHSDFLIGFDKGAEGKSCKDIEKDYIITEEDIANGAYAIATKRVFYHKHCLTGKTEKELAEIVKNNGEGYKCLPNLAGRKEEADAYIKAELEMAGIDIIHEPNNACETDVSYTGKLGEFTFKRAWRYWMVSGFMPYEYAVEMYNDPIGKKDVRVAGHCGCPHPEGYIEYFSPQGKKYAEIKELESYIKKYGDSPIIESLKNSKDIEWVDDPSKMGVPAIIDHYHIDSLEGLKLFVKYVRKVI